MYSRKDVVPQENDNHYDIDPQRTVCLEIALALIRQAHVASPFRVDDCVRTGILEARHWSVVLQWSNFLPCNARKPSSLRRANFLCTFKYRYRSTFFLRWHGSTIWAIQITRRRESIYNRKWFGISDPARWSFFEFRKNWKFCFHRCMISQRQ